jgi:hypothetical protein
MYILSPKCFLLKSEKISLVGTPRSQAYQSLVQDLSAAGHIISISANSMMQKYVYGIRWNFLVSARHGGHYCTIPFALSIYHDGNKLIETRQSHMKAM